MLNLALISTNTQWNFKIKIKCKVWKWKDEINMLNNLQITMYCKLGIVDVQVYHGLHHKYNHESLQKLQLLTKIAISTSPKDPSFLSHESKLWSHYHKENFQLCRNNVQTIKPPNPNVHTT